MDMQRNCCYECEKYEKYYLKRKANFASAGAGFCVERYKTVSSTDVCELFKKVSPQEQTISKQDAYQAMVKIADLLAQVKQILDEDVSFD